MSNSFADHRQALLAGYALQEYVIDSVLGVGGFGITYLARDTHLNMQVAVKEYLPNSLAVRVNDHSVHPKSAGDEATYRWGLDRFLKEAQTLARFRHPHIVRVLRFFQGNGSAYMVMEYEEGQSLATILKTQPEPMSEQFLLQLLLPMLDGLKRVHQEGFLHRDIKPSNILVRPDGSPVLIDFGSARLAVSDMTQQLTSIFTPGFAPFEQYFSDGKQGPWTDIYALGAIVYLCITGVRPVDAASRVKKDTLVPASVACQGAFSPGFLCSVDAALKLGEEERPQDIEAWERMLSQASPVEHPASPGRPPSEASAAPSCSPRPTAAGALQQTNRGSTSPASSGPTDSRSEPSTIDLLRQFQSSGGSTDSEDRKDPAAGPDGTSESGFLHTQRAGRVSWRKFIAGLGLVVMIGVAMLSLAYLGNEILSARRPSAEAQPRSAPGAEKPALGSDAPADADRKDDRVERPPGPPPEAIAACQGRPAGATCSFTDRENKSLTGSCVMPATRNSGPSEPGGETGDGLANGSANPIVMCRPGKAEAEPARISPPAGRGEQHEGPGKVPGAKETTENLERRPPPPEAIAACRGKSVGAMCSFVDGRNANLSGNCITPPVDKPDASVAAQATGKDEATPDLHLICRPRRPPEEPAAPNPR